MPQVELLVVASARQAPGLRARVMRELQTWGVRLDGAAADMVGVIVSNTFATALHGPHLGQLVIVRLVLSGHELAVEVFAGATTFPPHRTADAGSAGRFPRVLAIYAVETGIETGARGTRYWATVHLPAPARRRRRWPRLPRPYTLA
ncbi:hypothetical protein [Kitasatospora sp. NPDC090091]|uniref:hypothetical protein n=1 Tax=Kitasatospora sp. NPDC090091 TaxID=3364081 RepID=UPI003816C6F2